MTTTPDDTPDDGLFPRPGRTEPAHPDDVVAKEEIARYFTDVIAEARAALAKAQAEVDRHEAALATWLDRGVILDEGWAGPVHMAASMVAAHSSSRYQRAAHEAIFRGGDRDEATRLGERERALRRWLTAHGYNLGDLAEPAPAPVTPGAGRRRRGAAAGKG